MKKFLNYLYRFDLVYLLFRLSFVPIFLGIVTPTTKGVPWWLPIANIISYQLGIEDTWAINLTINRR